MSITTPRARMALAGAAVGLATAAVAVAASPSGPKVGPTASDAVSVPVAQVRDCTKQTAAGAPGVFQRPWTAPADGAVHLRLQGTGDWDLALFGAARTSSSGFRGNEVITAYVRAGQAFTVQACRRTGAVPGATLKTTFTPLAGMGAAAPRVAVVRVPLVGRSTLTVLRNLGLDVTEHVRDGHADVLLHGDRDRRILAGSGLPFEVEVADLAAFHRRERAKEAAWRARIGDRSTLPSGRTGYRDLAEIQAELKKLATDHPGVVRPVTLPHQTYQGRSVEGIEIARDVNAGDGRPTFFLMGLHHAREWPAAEGPMEFANLLLTQSSDPRVAKVLDSVRTVIVPVINPDGYVESRGAVAVPEDDPAGGVYTVQALVGAGTYRRKNCFGALPAAAPCAAQYGVDPNRNYGEKWGGPGASATPEQQDYRGGGQWSELETQNVHEFSQQHNVTTMITTHNVAALVLRSPGLKSQGLAPDEAILKNLGDAMGKATGYTSQYGWQLYDTTGTTEDWNYAAAGTLGYTIEMGPANGQFHMSYETGVVKEWEGATTRTKGKGLREAYLLTAEAAADRAVHSTVRGRAPAGRVLTLTKSFQTFTSPICSVNSTTGGRLITDEGTLRDTVSCANPQPATSFDDGLTYTMTVPASGRYDWIVTPSSRPFELRAGKAETWTLSCTDPSSGAVFDKRDVLIGRGEVREFDLPCGGVLPPVTGPSVTDKLKPRVRIHRSTLKATRRGMRLHGTARDRAPQGATPSLRVIQVAVARKAGSRCRFLDARGRAGAARSCARPVYLKAAGTTQWTFVLRRALRAGRYVASVRAVDRAGNRGPRAMLAFRVK